VEGLKVPDKKTKAALQKLDDRLTAYLKDFVRAEVIDIPNQHYNLLKFSDGFQCYSNTAKIETELQYKEIFADREYFQYGVTIKDNGVVFDVGANIGMFVMFLNKNTSNVKMYAFEPIPDTFKTLQANMKLHDIKNVNLYNIALGAENKKRVTFTHYLNMTANTTLFPESKDFQKKREVLKGIKSCHWPIIKHMVIEVHNATKKLPEIKAILKHKNIDMCVEQGNTGPMDNCNVYCTVR
jgi:hypothetical protein